jgi:hypothetical protein
MGGADARGQPVLTSVRGRLVDIHRPALDRCDGVRRLVGRLGGPLSSLRTRRSTRTLEPSDLRRRESFGRHFFYTFCAMRVDIANFAVDPSIGERGPLAMACAVRGLGAMPGERRAADQHATEIFARDGAGGGRPAGDGAAPREERSAAGRAHRRR